jgi:hypothetical protein
MRRFLSGGRKRLKTQEWRPSAAASSHFRMKCPARATLTAALVMRAEAAAPFDVNGREQGFVGYAGRTITFVLTGVRS